MAGIEILALATFVQYMCVLTSHENFGQIDVNMKNHCDARPLYFQMYQILFFHGPSPLEISIQGSNKINIS
jgi:hypothetical protein